MSEDQNLGIDFEGQSDREKVIREQETPWPKSMTELNEVLGKLLSGVHTYGSVAEAMGMAAAATINFMGSHMGCTGFQASFADLIVLRRQRSLKGPFKVMKVDEVFYPQYDIFRSTREFVSESSEWISGEAKKKLAAIEGQEETGYAPQVLARIQALADANGDADAILQILEGGK